MDRENSDLIKQRQVPFMELHPDPDQAATAAEMLIDVEGILDAEALSPTLLNVRYHLLEVSLEQIESALTETGFHLSNRPIYALKRALYYYTEETQRANNGCPRGESNCTRKIFIDRYRRRDHSLRDPRPEHWRKYL
jgi:hypothetical protein